MTRRLLFVLLLTLALPIHAEYYYRYIGYSCDVKKDKLIINYTTIPYEGDYKPKKKRHRWELGALIETKESDKAHTFISKITKIVRHCKLGNGTYKITFSPAPGNHDLEGQCGAHMSAWAEVTLAACRT